jgi:hypothetical protein
VHSQTTAPWDASIIPVKKGTWIISQKKCSKKLTDQIKKTGTSLYGIVDLNNA